jgi:hypothetical protein
MADALVKDPERVMYGRLGALTVHARGRTNTVPASAAFMARFETEVDPEGVLLPAERARRAEYARRAHMTRLVLRRWHPETA